MCVASVVSTVVTAMCIVECHTRASPLMVPCLSCLYAEHMCGRMRVNSLTSEVCSAKVPPFRDTWGWWRECLGNSQVVWEFKHPPFPPYCAFPLGHSQMVFRNTSPTCVLGGECFGIDQPVRAASSAPHGHPYHVPVVSPFLCGDTKFSLVCRCCTMTARLFDSGSRR